MGRWLSLTEDKTTRRRRLIRDFENAVTDAHKAHEELIEMEPPQEYLGVVQLYGEYTIGKGSVRPKDDTLRFIMEDDFRNRRPREEEKKKIMEYRKILEVLRKYNNINWFISRLYNDGATFKTVWGQTVIDGSYYYEI